MFSILEPTFLYTDVSEDITENDIDVVSDIWNMDGRDVYRGSRDPRYTHANVYWLYSEDLQRVGCSEHSLADHADFRLLWFRDSEFATLFQEDDWIVGSDVWSILPRRVFEKFMNEGWSTPERFLEHCLNGPMRVVTPDMVIKLPEVYSCSVCGRKSLSRSGLGETCSVSSAPLDFPDKQKVFCIDFDMVVHVPPTHSELWSRLQPHDDGSSQLPEREQALAEREATPPPAAPLHRSPAGAPERERETVPVPEEHEPPPQSHPQTPEQPSDAGEERHERT